ncbi:MAG TPA: DUF5666 domain-containing protein [Terriglobales bacterium]|jgi:hypothetical protein|nr:DUF5666 domain-containing protein [Terriglobales bacterium]
MECLRRSLGAYAGRMMLVLALASLALGQTPQADGKAQVARAVGTIKSKQADTLTLGPDGGGEVTATLSESTKILRVPPGETTLKNATPLQPQDLQPGDRVLVRGQGSADGKSIAALSVVVMKQADVSAKQEHDRDDWQKRGVGGLVTAVDAVSGAITISSAGLTGNRNVVIHTAKTTSARRYAPDSVKFDDAKPAPVEQIKVGDQLRARGKRNADGSELTAEDIVFGSFRNIAGTVTAVDAPSNAMTVHDLIGKGSVVVKVTSDSQIKKLPAEMAQRIAARLKGGAGEGGGQGPASGQSPAASPGNAAGGSPRSASGSGGGQWQRGSGNGNAGGPPDLQRFLGRLPNSTLADLQKGDAVMIVSTQSADPGTVTAITVLGGVEPIMTASPNGRATTLSPWSLSAGGAEGESAQ